MLLALCCLTPEHYTPTRKQLAMLLASCFLIMRHGGACDLLLAADAPVLAPLRSAAAAFHYALGGRLQQQVRALVTAAE